MKKIEKKNNNEWWDIRGKYKILHKINSLRTNFIIDNYDKTIEKKTILFLRLSVLFYILKDNIIII